MDGNSINATVSSAPANHTVKPDFPDAQPTLIKPVEDTKNMESVQSDQTDIIETIDFIEDFMQTIQRDLEFSIDNDTGSIMVTVRDRHTGEIIRKMPSDGMREIAKRLDEIVGLLFDESV